MTGKAEALKNEGNARKAAGDLAGAIERYRRALEAQPGYVAALYNLGVALREHEELEESEACFRRLLDIEPSDVDALFNLGSLQRRRLDLAGAERTYRRALEIAPGNAPLWLMLGETGIARYTDESLRDAVRCFRKAIELAPALADAHYHLAQARELEGAQGDALEGYKAALRFDPGNVAYRTALLSAKQRSCDWQGLDELWAETHRTLAGDPGQLMDPFVLLTMPSTPAEQLQCAARNARSIMESARQARRAEFGFDRPASARLRIGYLSAEFHAHATAYLTAELFELHDRGRFEIFAYSYGPEDHSAIRGRVRRAFDRFVDVRALSDADAARAIHADGIDILVDLKGYTFRARPGILALRPAPLQVGYLGYPGTTGAPFIDYLVGDRIVTPPADAAYYSEKLVVMPDSYQVNDRRRALGAAPSRRELGLPERGTVFCCFNQAYKILPDVFALWMRLLQALPNSVLWLLEWNPEGPVNLRREARRLGVDPARLVFSPLTSVEAHLSRLQVADLFLDTFPYNAHTTASEALWSGLPLVTVTGDTFASRVASSLLHAAGLPELVTRSFAEY
ncbi:MAG TPA: tetratricopeptide repeat protein, partial [Burkholderiales bacterium]|nr:tetratricopeptide repeat protein [Burkholderiales bacterium]